MDVIRPLLKSLAPIVLAAVVHVAQPGVAVAQGAMTELRATYYIAIAGLTIGRAEVEGRFARGQYATAISGSTFGISRFVSDASAILAGNGRIKGTTVLPSTYNMQTREGDFGTLVRMAMSGGAVTDVFAQPGLVEASDRIPVLQRHKSDIVDPIGAFVVSLGERTDADGEFVCDRTVRVFDGWQRFDVALHFKRTTDVRSGYRGRAIVCGARYIPVAGHRPEREAVQFMAENKRLEVWLIPVRGTNVMVPYQFVIGTKAGNLTVTARDFEVSRTERRTSTR